MRIFSRQNILVGLVVVIAIGAIYLWNANSQRNYRASRQNDCIQLAERKKTEFEKDNTNKFIRTATYVYFAKDDDCVFEDSIVALSGDNSIMLMSISGLFSGNKFATVTLPLGKKDETSKTLSSDAAQNCLFYNKTRLKYFPSNPMNCIGF